MKKGKLISFVAIITSLLLMSGITMVNLTSQVVGVLPAGNGGTGVANSGTVTVSGNVTIGSSTHTVTFATGANTSVTVPASGTLATLAGSETFTNKTLTSPIINVGSDANYDMYYRNSSGVFTRLANGTTGQYLAATTSGAPSWATPSASVTERTFKHTSSSINFRSTGVTTVYTTEPSLGRFTVTGIYILVTAQSGVTGTLGFTIGVPAANTSIHSSGSIAAASWTLDRQINETMNIGNFPSVAASTNINFSIATAFSGGTATGTVTVLGFYQSNN